MKCFFVVTILTFSLAVVAEPSKKCQQAYKDSISVVNEMNNHKNLSWSEYLQTKTSKKIMDRAKLKDERQFRLQEAYNKFIFENVSDLKGKSVRKVLVEQLKACKKNGM